MTVASPPRPRAPRARHVVEQRPMRNPDASSTAVMTRRGWWLVVLDFLLPGSAQVLAGNSRLGRFGLGATLAMWVLALAGAATFALWRPLFLTVATFWPVLILVEALIIAYAVLWIVLTLDTLRLVRLIRTGPWARVGIALLAVVLMVVTTGGAFRALQVVDATRGTITTIFGQSGPSVAPSDGYYNILLLGADSGTGRDSMRFDSISVVSINADSGAVTITGIPRDMVDAPFPEGSPMLALYPDGHTGFADAQCGWGSGINQLNTELEVCRDGAAIYPDAARNGSTPGIQATKDAAAGVLGIEIPYYAFLDMAGFAALVDALGGVDLTVTERLPEGGGPAYEGQPAEDWASGWIEVGDHHMTGDTAQWYARSRYTTSDWDRMKRQRELQEAILEQFSPTNVLSRFQDVAAAGQNLVQTDVPQSMLGYFTDLGIKAKEHEVQTIELTPEGGVEEQQPDFAYIREMVHTALHPPSPTPTPAG